MMNFLKRLGLGRLETEVMDILWSRGESNVHEVTQKLERPLAYTTVMTTLDRLFKKGLLERRKLERAFTYSAKLSRSELLFSCLVDAVGPRDAELLDELERKIKLKRRELERSKNP
jgi:predicted transcriptional regulator